MADNKVYIDLTDDRPAKRQHLVETKAEPLTHFRTGPVAQGRQAALDLSCTDVVCVDLTLDDDDEPDGHTCKQNAMQPTNVDAAPPKASSGPAPPKGRANTAASSAPESHQEHSQKPTPGRSAAAKMQRGGHPAGPSATPRPEVPAMVGVHGGLRTVGSDAIQTRGRQVDLSSPPSSPAPQPNQPVTRQLPAPQHQLAEPQPLQPQAKQPAQPQTLHVEAQQPQEHAQPGRKRAAQHRPQPEPSGERPLPHKEPQLQQHQHQQPPDPQPTQRPSAAQPPPQQRGKQPSPHRPGRQQEKQAPPRQSQPPPRQGQPPPRQGQPPPRADARQERQETLRLLTEQDERLAFQLPALMANDRESALRFINLLHAQNATLSRIKDGAAAVLDAQQHALLSTATLTSTRRLEQQSGRTPQDLVRALQGVFGAADGPGGGAAAGPGPSSAGAGGLVWELDWKRVASYAAPLFRPVAGPHVQFGPLEAPPKQRRQAAQRRKPEPVAKVMRPQEYNAGQGNAEQTDTFTSHIMESMLTNLRDIRDAEPAAGEVVTLPNGLRIPASAFKPLVEIILDRAGFAQTVENMHALGYLMAQGWVALWMDGEDRLTLAAITKEEHHQVKRSGNAGGGSAASASGAAALHRLSHMVIPLEMADWRTMCKCVPAERCVMPSRTYLGDEDGTVAGAGAGPSGSGAGGSGVGAGGSGAGPSRPGGSAAGGSGAGGSKPRK